MVDEATPGTAPSIDSVIDTIVREDDAREQVETQAPVATEPEEPQAPDPEPEAPEPEAEPTYTVKVRGAEGKGCLLYPSDAADQ